MSAPTPDDIERLLAWSDDAGQQTGGDGRLAAALSQALSPDAKAAPAGDDLAEAAAYLDGVLSGPQRDAMLARLSGSAQERADLADAASLLDAVEQAPLKAPAHLLAQAKARLAQEVPAKPEARRWSLAGLTGPRLVWTMAAAAAALIIAPVSLMRTQAPLPLNSATLPGPIVAPPGGGAGPAIQAAPASSPQPMPAAAAPAMAPAVALAPRANPSTGADAYAQMKAEPAADAGAYMEASDRCDTDVAAPAPVGAYQTSLSAREREARDACEAARALARRHTETMAAARQADFDGAQADVAAAAHTDAYHAGPVEADAPAAAAPAVPPVPAPSR